MDKSPFSVYTRPGRDGKEVYAVRFKDDSGRIIKSLTLKAKNRTQAVREADKLHRDGVVPTDSNPEALQWLAAFWTRVSDYVQGRALRGVDISEGYLRNNRCLVAKHLARPLKGLRLLDITPDILERAMLAMHKAGAGPRTINAAMQSIKVPYGHFCKLHRLANPLTCIEKAREKPLERGVLRLAEVAALATLPVDSISPKVKAGVLLAVGCGLRLGEVRGLQWSDVLDDSIQVNQNFVTESEGLKGPKWGSSREVSLPAFVSDALRVLQETAPEGCSFVIHNENSKCLPACAKTLQYGFHAMLEAIGIHKAERISRNLVFHSLRHSFVTNGLESGLSNSAVMAMAGHRSEEMTRRYNHAAQILDFTAAKATMDAAMKKAGGA